MIVRYSSREPTPGPPTRSLRFSSPLFRLGSADAINAKVTFPVSGSVDGHQGVIVMRVDDIVGADVDPALKGLVVVFNASASAVDQKLPGMKGANLALSPVQSAGSDAVVKTSTWDGSTSTLSVPARTVRAAGAPSFAQFRPLELPIWASETGLN